MDDLFRYFNLIDDKKPISGIGLSDMPVEIVLHMLSFCEMEDISRMFLASRYFHNILRYRQNLVYIYSRIINRRYHIPLELAISCVDYIRIDNDSGKRLRDYGDQKISGCDFDKVSWCILKMDTVLVENNNLIVFRIINDFIEDGYDIVEKIKEFDNKDKLIGSKLWIKRKYHIASFNDDAMGKMLFLACQMNSMSIVKAIVTFSGILSEDILRCAERCLDKGIREFLVINALKSNNSDHGVIKTCFKLLYANVVPEDNEFYIWDDFFDAIPDQMILFLSEIVMARIPDMFLPYKRNDQFIEAILPRIANNWKTAFAQHGLLISSLLKHDMSHLLENILRILYFEKFKVNDALAKFNFENTLLSECCRYGWIQGLKILQLSLGNSDKRWKSNDNGPIRLACENQHINVVMFLISIGCVTKTDITHSNDGEILSRASRCGDTTMLVYLFETFKITRNDLEKPHKLVYQTCEKNHLKTFEYLIRKLNYKVHELSSDSVKIIEYAVYSGNPDFVSVLSRKYRLDWNNIKNSSWMMKFTLINKKVDALLRLFSEIHITYRDASAAYENIVDICKQHKLQIPYSTPFDSIRIGGCYFP